MVKPNKRITPNKVMNRPMRVNLNVRGSISNETTVTGNSYSIAITTSDEGTDAFIYPICPISPFGLVNTSTVRQIARFYTEYKFLASTQIHWEPRCPLTSTGNYWVAWTENPDYIVAFLTGTPTARLALVKTLTNAKCYPIWQSSTHRIGPPRRNWFTVDNSLYNATGSADERELVSMDYDRALQGVFVYAVEGAQPLQEVAIMYSNEQIKVRGLHGTFAS